MTGKPTLYGQTAELRPSMNVANDLRGRQSVRTTFKLSADAIHAMSLVAAHLGIKQKSLFDHMMENLDALHSLAAGMSPTEPAGGRVQKTYVISRRSLELLERIAKAAHAPRDMVVEFSVQRLMPIIEEERIQHERRKSVLAGLEAQVRAADDLLNQTRNLLGDSDPVSAKVAGAVGALHLAYRQVEEFVQRGRIIEEEPHNAED